MPFVFKLFSMEMSLCIGHMRLITPMVFFASLFWNQISIILVICKLFLKTYFACVSGRHKTDVYMCIHVFLCHTSNKWNKKIHKCFLLIFENLVPNHLNKLHFQIAIEIWLTIEKLSIQDHNLRADNFSYKLLLFNK